MSPRPALCDLLGIRHPIIQAPMAQISTAPLVTAVGKAGAIGTLGTAVFPPDAVAAEARAASDVPYILNFFCHAEPRADAAVAERMWRRLEPYRRALGLEELPLPALTAPPPFGAATLEVVLALRPPAVSFHFGLPDDAALRALRAAGTILLATATNVDEARQLEARGVQAIIAQGVEAGGHRGTFAPPFADGELGTMALVPQIVDAVSVPVIAAGGIHDGRGIAAALRLGAAGVQMGTAFLGCPEAVLDPVYRRTLFEPRAARTRLTKLFSGRPARAIATRFLDEMAAEEDRVLEFPLQRALTTPLARASAARGDAEHLSMWAGQAAAKTRALPAGELVATLVRELGVTAP